MVQTTTDIDKRTAILRATLDLVAENGFHGTPMSQVAKRSGVSTGIIYHYFEGKDDLIHALYMEIKTAYSAALLAGDSLGLPWPDHLKRIWLNAFHFYATHPKETLFLEQYENSPYQHNFDEESLDDNFRLLMGLIRDDFAAGVIREMPFEVLYELTLGVAAGLAKRQIGGAVNLDDDLLDEIASVICRAVER